MNERTTPEASAQDAQLRQRAIKRLEDRRGLMAHLVAYTTVNLLLVAIWWTSGADFFWPVFPILGWGIGLAFHIWEYAWPAADEDRIEAEMERMRHRHA